MKSPNTAMPVTTQDDFKEYNITQTLGIVSGNTVRTRHIGNDILAVLRTIVGGEIPEYTKMLTESRQQAVERMLKQARDLGADGVVGVRFVTASVLTGASEILAYGTAVKLARKA